MSEAEVQRYIQQVLQDTASHMISTDTAMAAAEQLIPIAAQEEAEWAIAGGVAMHLYGSPRLTKDLDIIASKHLSLTPDHPLGFGGSSYTLQVGKYAVQIDWIVRSDNYQKYYRAALRDAVTLPNGLRIITPGWLVILKLNAGRQKDHDDAIFLLQQPNLVSRPDIKRKIVETMSEDVWYAMLPGFRRLCDLADQHLTEPSKYYDQE